MESKYMNLVQVQVLDCYESSVFSEFFFYTEKPKEYFCINDRGLITKEFLELLIEKYPDSCKNNLEKKVFYYHKDIIETI